MVTTVIYLALPAMRQAALWGQDLANYFPVPPVLACPDLVTESALEVTYKNFTPVIPLAMHR